MRTLLRLGLLAGALMVALVLAHGGLTAGARTDGALGRLAAGTCAACH